MNIFLKYIISYEYMKVNLVSTLLFQKIQISCIIYDQF